MVEFRLCSFTPAIAQKLLDWIQLDGMGLDQMGLRVHSHFKIVGFALEKECKSSCVSCSPSDDWITG